MFLVGSYVPCYGSTFYVSFPPPILHGILIFTTLHIASNIVLHKRTKLIEIDCLFIKEKILSGDTTTSFVNLISNDHLANVVTKSLRHPRINYFLTSLAHMTCMAKT